MSTRFTVSYHHLWGNKGGANKVQESLLALCEQVTECVSHIKKGEILFSGLEEALENEVKPSEISKCHTFMQILTTFGHELMASEKGKEGFYLGIFCELNLSKSWHDLKFVKFLKSLFKAFLKKTIEIIPFEMKKKLIAKLKSEDERLFYHFFPREENYS